jgi:hypothetical protein
VKITDLSPDKIVNDQLEHLRAKNAELDREVSRLRKFVGEQKEMAQLVVAAVKASDPLKPVPWKSPPKSGKPVIPVLVLSDLHIGEVVDSGEVEGFNAFDWNIAQSRATYIVTSFLKWVETLRHGYKIDEAVVLGVGDYISGGIHYELAVTNEFPVPVQTAKAGMLVGNVVATVAPHFGKVTFYQVGADNHGRMNAKPQFKQKSENSFSYLVHTIASSVLEKHKNVEIITAKGMKHLCNINGFKFLVEHGDTVKSFMSIPYYGLERARAREATRRMNTDMTFDYMTIGHFHCPALIAGNILVNGSLSGTSEFDHGCGRHAPPSQIAFLVHPEHGMFGFTPFKTNI